VTTGRVESGRAHAHQQKMPGSEASVVEGAVPGTQPVDSAGEERARREPSSTGARGITVILKALEVGPVVILALLVMVMGIASDVFLSLENIGNVLKQSAVISVLALGQLLVILTRGIDLSVGSNLSLSAVVGAIVRGRRCCRCWRHSARRRWSG
jgi:hypothetical protein